LEKDGEAVGRLRQWRRQAKLAWLPGGAPDRERGGDVVGDDLRDRRVPIDDDDRTATSHPAQVAAQVRFQVRDADPAHDLIMVITGHIVKPAETLVSFCALSAKGLARDHL
jgi:hypothetical protein